MPNTPKTLNHIKLTSAGTNKTPEINSLIERPLDTCDEYTNEWTPT